jgi:membrane-associated HD superfamily phosphohydrolase
MRMRTRKLIGAVLLIVWVVIWPFIGLSFTQSAISRYYAPAQLIFFVLLGLVWIVPAMGLIRWMQRPDLN